MRSTSTHHTVMIGDARELPGVPAESVDLVITSPPYPMIEMWDEAFAAMSPEVGTALAAGDGKASFESMHAELDKVWRKVAAALRPGGFVCVNIGDATRSISGRFQLFSNHARVISAFLSLSFDVLPTILWRKPTNAPNKFMGSGMLPAGAYVTLEHEHILIFRKGGKRTFASAAERKNRAESAFFWEERNEWFSDVWDFRGIRQNLAVSPSRARSAAFPFELAYRLVNMYSVYGDTVLDPFLGTGTTMVAAIASGRNSVGVELEPDFLPLIKNSIKTCPSMVNMRIHRRFSDHLDFIADRSASGKEVKHVNANHQCPVMTRQEVELRMRKVDSLSWKSATEAESTHSLFEYTHMLMEPDVEQLALAL